MNIHATITALLALSLAAATTPAGAQGTRADYERAMSLSRRISNTVFRRSVSPHWLSGNNAFWYRLETGPDKWEFVYVDAVKGERRAAFDHQKLAGELARELGKPVAPDALPFTWIAMPPDGAWVRFRTEDKTWQFQNGALRTTNEPVNEARLAPLPEPHPSFRTGDATAITFINRTPGEITLYWFDPDGARQRYETVAPGATHRRSTYSGHVWQAEDAGGKSLGVYEATDDETQAIIEATPTTPNVPHTQTEPKQPPPARVEGAPETPRAPRPSVFIRDNNVWIRNGGGQPGRLTSNGTPDNAYQEPFFPSPDGRYLVARQVVPEQEHPVHLVESSPPGGGQPRMRTIQYLKPGDRVEQERPRLFDLQTKREIPTSAALFTNPWDISEEGWSEDGKFHFLFNQRGHQALRMLEMDTTGHVRALVDERSSTFINYSDKTYLHWLPETHELIWMSERDGWNHLYLYDTQTGRVKNQITKGQWVVREVERVDEARRQIWFKVLGIVPGQDPYYAHLARINFDGTGLTVLTSGDGTHKWTFSPDNRYLLDTYSRVDAPPVSELHDANTGRRICTLETADIGALTAAGWTMPERFQAMGRDGTTPIYGIIIRPSNFDPAKRYPVIEEIYSGPQDFFVPKAFDTLDGMHEMAELGFVVVQIDGMGTNWRSRAFHDVCYKNLHDAGLPDHIAWLKAAGATRPWLDLARVGIEGVSAGGQNALAALLWHGDFYKAAIADCGCHDNRMDKIWWNEAWMGWPVGPEYAANSNVTHAANLQGNLFLIVGEMDTNVDPASTMQVADALIKANKDFDLLVVPGAGHGAGGSEYGTRRRRDFFVRHLLGVEPPARNGA